MIKGRKVYDPLTNTWSTGYWVKDDKNILYPVWSEYSFRSSYKGGLSKKLNLIQSNIKKKLEGLNVNS